MHLGRFSNFSQNVDGVTLICSKAFLYVFFLNIGGLYYHNPRESVCCQGKLQKVTHLGLNKCCG